MDVAVLLSARPKHLSRAARIAPGVEVKLDWEDAAELGDGRTLTDVCEENSVEPDDIVSVHLPPGTTNRNGMAAADGNVGKITDFTHTAFGDAVEPEWLTLHSARRFDYRTHVETLGTITDVTGYPIALENAPDGGQLHTPEAMAVLAFLAERVERLDDTYLLVDTAHVPADCSEPAVDEEAVTDVLDGMDDELRRRVEEEFRGFLRERISDVTLELDPDDPWRPALVALRMVGGDRVRAVHLNEPVEDGTPDVENASEGLRATVEFCREHDVATVLEPGKSETEQTNDAIEWLTNYA